MIYYIVYDLSVDVQVILNIRNCQDQGVNSWPFWPDNTTCLLKSRSAKHYNNDTNLFSHWQITCILKYMLVICAYCAFFHRYQQVFFITLSTVKDCRHSSSKLGLLFLHSETDKNIPAVHHFCGSTQWSWWPECRIQRDRGHGFLMYLRTSLPDSTTAVSCCYKIFNGTKSNHFYYATCDWFQMWCMWVHSFIVSVDAFFLIK